MIQLVAHPFSSYCWKALIALDEKGLAFEYRALGPDHPENGAMLALAPTGKFPILIDGDRVVIETSVIVEYLDRLATSPAMIPADPDQALEARMLDRVFDSYVMAPMQWIVADFIRPPEQRDPLAVSEAKAMLTRSYAWINARLGDREWATGADFTLPDCAAAPSLFYADWVHPIPEDLGRLRAYRARLLARPSVAKAVDAARPYRGMFPPGAPDRD